MQTWRDEIQEKLKCPNEWDKKYLQSCLRVAALLHLPDVAEKLIEEKNVDGTSLIDVNATDDHLNTALIIAAGSVNIEVVRLLLTREDINVNHQNISKVTALMCACHEGNTEIVKILMQQENININLMNVRQENALTVACYKKRHEVISLLLQREELERSQSNILKVAKFVMRRNVDNNDMRLVIEEAVRNNFPHIARWLLLVEGYLLKTCSTSALLRVGTIRSTCLKKTSFHRGR